MKVFVTPKQVEDALDHAQNLINSGANGTDVDDLTCRGGLQHILMSLGITLDIRENG